MTATKTTSVAAGATDASSKKKQKLVKAAVSKAVKPSTTTTSRSSSSGMVTPSDETKKITATKSIDVNSIAALPTSVASKIDRMLIEKAVTALLKHHSEVTEKDTAAKGKLPLLDNTVPVQVQFGLEFAPSQKKMKPIRIYIPHSIYQLSSSSSESNDKNNNNNNNDQIMNENSVDEAEICLIVKDDTTKANVIEMKEQFPQYMKNISKVITLPSLRTKYGEHSQRRVLLSLYTHFIADDRILPMLTAALGKDFIQAKKQPIPISMTRKSVLPHSIKNAILHATYLFIPDGTCITIRAGNTTQTISQIVDNIISVVVHVPNKVPRQWANIKNINIKLPASIALPIYNQTPSELIEIAQMAGIPSMWVNDDDDDDEKTNTKTKTTDQKTTTVSISEAVNKKKSPLLKAIEKQKKEDRNTAKDTSKKTSKIDELNKSSTTETKSEKKRKQSETGGKEKDVTIPSAVSKPKQTSDDKVSVASPSKKVKTTTVAVDATSASQNSTSTTTKASKKDDDDTKKSNDTTLKAFIATKKFQGPKTGYVFHVGTLGLGYYKDQPPKVVPRPTTNNSKNNNQRRTTISPHKSNAAGNNTNKKQRRSR